MGIHLGAQLGQFSLIFQGLFFDPIFDQIFGEKTVTVAGNAELGWGGGFLAGDPFTGFYWQVRSVRLAAGLQPGAADPVALRAVPATVPDFVPGLCCSQGGPK